MRSYRFYPFPAIAFGFLVAAFLPIGFLGCSNPDNNLATNVSSTQAEMADIERKVSSIMRTEFLPPELFSEGPLLTELPAVADEWVTAGSGDAKDPFGQKPDSRYYFARLSSGNWFLLARGPDGDIEIGPQDLRKWDSAKRSTLLNDLSKIAFDPTNGSRSNGDLFRIGAIPFR